MISVIIATYGRIEILSKVLQSLTEQIFKREDFEVIVVEDYLNPETKSIIDKFNKKVNLYYYSCGVKGAAAKRNFGVKMCKSDIILFLDDDMIASPALLSGHYNFYNSGADAVLGHIEEDKAVKLNLFTRYLLESDLQNTYKNINPDNVAFEYFYTGNLSLKKDIFNKLGGFNIKFKQYGFEDIELGYRFRKARYIMKYNKNALGYHHFLRTFEDYLMRKFMMGKSAKYFAYLYPELKSHLSIHPRKFKEILLVNRLTKNCWIKKAKKTEEKENLNTKEKKELYKIYEYLLNYYYWKGIKSV